MRAFSKTLAAVLLCGAASLAQAAETAICYNCPPDWRSEERRVGKECPV